MNNNVLPFRHNTSRVTQLPADDSPDERRRKLWELPAPCICPVVGACLDIGHVRQCLDALFGGSSSHLDDFGLHVALVGQCGERNKVAELVHRELDLAHADALEASATLDDESALASLWSRAVATSDVAGAFWATVSHPFCSDSLMERVLADMHMVQHRSIAALRQAADARDRLEVEVERLRALSAARADDLAASERARAAAAAASTVALARSSGSPSSRFMRWALGGLTVAVLTVLTVAAVAVHAQPAPAASAAAPRYTFSWPLDAVQPAPRGGTTRGAPVVLDTSPSPAWRALQAAGLDAPERDRRAILAMAGTYRVSFDFLEVATFGPGARPAPYQSWGTEKVYVDRDEPGFISLVHILEMRLLGSGGAVSEPFVTKHWRQDWRYEPERVVEYQGFERWQRRALSVDERRGAWLQTVHQVDESPRYAALGRWQHSASFSTWLSDATWRPLPRREWSVRDDYQVLLGSNRHTVVPTGWLQEENNLKAVLATTGSLDAAKPYVGREVGMARYERLQAGADFAEADRYYAKTRTFWNEVAARWDEAFQRRGTITMRGPDDKLKLFVPLFDRAERIAGSTDASSVDRAEIEAIVDKMQATRRAVER